MTNETLLKANVLVDKIKECKENLKKIGYTQSEDVEIRKSYFLCNGIEDSVIIPKRLFRAIGKLIECEYTQKIDELQKELDAL